MTTTQRDEIVGLLEQVNEATLALRRSPEGVPHDVVKLVEGLDGALHAEAPLQLETDPYLSTALFAGALLAVKALGYEDATLRRRELRVALEQFRHALRDVIDAQPVGADEPVGNVLDQVMANLSVPQPDVAGLLGVSPRQLQRWLASEGPTPTGDAEARIRGVAQIVNQLRHVFTAPGVVAWFDRPHPQLGTPPAKLLDDPIEFPKLAGLAQAARATNC